MNLDSLMQQVKETIAQHADQPAGFDPEKLLSEVESLFNQHKASLETTQPRGMDPYAENVDESGKLLPASEKRDTDRADSGS